MKLTELYLIWLDLEVKMYLGGNLTTLFRELAQCTHRLHSCIINENDIESNMLHNLYTNSLTMCLSNKYEKLHL